MIRLKKVEEMVEVHYNSGQFANTMEHLVKEFPSPFDLYVELGEYYEKKWTVRDQPFPAGTV